MLNRNLLVDWWRRPLCSSPTSPEHPTGVNPQPTVDCKQKKSLSNITKTISQYAKQHRTCTFQEHPLHYLVGRILVGFQDAVFTPKLALHTTFPKNCGRGESLGNTTCPKTVVAGKHGHAPCEISLLQQSWIQIRISWISYS